MIDEQTVLCRILAAFSRWQTDSFPGCSGAYVNYRSRLCGFAGKLFWDLHNKSRWFPFEKTDMTKRVSLIILMLLTAFTVTAQMPENDTSRWHASVATGLWMGSGFGRQQHVEWISPSVELRPNDRLTLQTGFTLTGHLLPQGYRVQVYGPSLAPRRTGTQTTSMWVAGQYKVNERLSVWASVAHATGYFQPIWLDQSVPLDVTSLSGGFAYKLGRESLFEMHLQLLTDRAGTAWMPMFTAWDSPWTGSPFDNYFMMW